MKLFHNWRLYVAFPLFYDRYQNICTSIFNKLIFNFFNRKFHVIYYPIFLDFGILIPRATKCNFRSKASLLSSHKEESMSLNIIMYYSSFSTNLLAILFWLLYIYILIIQFWQSTSVNVPLSYHFRDLLLWMF